MNCKVPSLKKEGKGFLLNEVKVDCGDIPLLNGFTVGRVYSRLEYYNSKESTSRRG